MANFCARPRLARFAATSATLAILLSFGIALAPARAEMPVAPDHAAKMAAGLKLFQTQVRPLLLQNCFKCHGGESVESGFNMNDRDSLLKGGDTGVVVVAGKSHDSLLYKLITHAKKPHMPQEAPKLPIESIARIAEWIDLGVPYDGPLKQKSGGTAAQQAAQQAAWTQKVLPASARNFWSFQPLKPVEPPAVKNVAWCRTPIDWFILAKMEAAGVKPNPPASKSQLIRRLYFDVVGLPPTPEEIAAFANDPAPDAYEKLVDRLLANPHFGERWARHWLDLARYAESGGFEHDKDRPDAYVYRDFVIRAINDDLPYDTFCRWQLAGDEFAPDNPQALAATGFIAAGVHSDQITKSEVERHRYDEMDDMLSTTGTAMLGLTIGCARCHDHKYDPILQTDYYRMLSAFTTTVRCEIDVGDHSENYRREKEKFDREHEPYVAALQKFEREKLPGPFAAWDKSSNPARQASADRMWLVLEPSSLVSLEHANFTRLDDGSWLASGPNGHFDTYTFIARTDLTGITGIRIEALADPSMIRGGPGRASNGNFDLTDFHVTAAPLVAKAQKPKAANTKQRKADGHEKTSPQDVALCNPRATFEQPGLPVRATIDGDPHSGWAIDPQFGRDQAAVYETTAPLGFSGGTLLTCTLQFRGNDKHNIGRLRISIRRGPPPAELLGASIPEPAVEAAALPAERRSPQQTAALLQWFRTTDPEWQKLNRAVQTHLAKAPKPAMKRLFVATEGLPPVKYDTQGDSFFKETYFLRRGDGNQKAGVAPLGVLQVLDTAPDKVRHWEIAPPAGWRTSYRRRAVANWITDTKYGAGDLLARVEVNRLWQLHIGRGIVATPSDFGARGERPTHPELLDWLAEQLIAAGWRPKAIHRMILTSAAYRQSSEFNEADAKADQYDRTFWRRPTQRLDAEAIRDSLLSVGNLLDPTMFGHSTLDPASRRRSIYLTVKRSKLIPMLSVFDGPDALGGLGKRETTTVAPQSLYLMNNGQVRECAQAMAGRIAPTPQTSLEAAVDAGYMVALGRRPSDGEAADSFAFLKQQIASYEQSHKPEARQLALADFCQALMCLNEFVYVD